LYRTIYGKLRFIEMESQYYRTFIGLPLQLGQAALEARADLIAALNGERISWVNPGNYHVTLRFIGDTGRTEVMEIGRALRAGLNIPEKRMLKLAELGSFGPRKKPRVSWVGFEQSDFFVELKNDVDCILEDCGRPIEKQDFTAHLTLGRIRSLTNLKHYYNTLNQMKQRFRSEVRFDSLVFYRSILGPRGPEYRIVEEFFFS
jgi:RNA 2',3'-cyclic 3'-phosphodiesterase